MNEVLLLTTNVESEIIEYANKFDTKVKWKELSTKLGVSAGAIYKHFQQMAAKVLKDDVVEKLKKGLNSAEIGIEKCFEVYWKRERK